MAIAFRAAGTAKTGTTSLSSMAQPAGTIIGDTLVALVVDLSTSNTNTTAPTGWTAKAVIASASGRLQIFTAVKGANGITGTSWTWSGLTTTSLGQIYGFSGGSTDFANQPDITPSVRANAAGSPSPTGTTTITPGHNADMVVAAYAAFGSSAANFWSAEKTANTPPGTLTERGDTNNSTTMTLALASNTMATAGATGASSATMSVTTRPNLGTLFSLKPIQTAAVATTATANSITTAGCTLVVSYTANDDAPTCVAVYDTVSRGAPGNVAPASSGYAGWSNASAASLSGSATVSLVDYGTGNGTPYIFQPNTTIYMRGCVQDGLGGFSYTSEISFTTPAFSCIFPSSTRFTGTNISGSAPGGVPTSVTMVAFQFNGSPGTVTPSGAFTSWNLLQLGNLYLYWAYNGGAGNIGSWSFTWTNSVNLAFLSAVYHGGILSAANASTSTATGTSTTATLTSSLTNSACYLATILAIEANAADTFTILTGTEETNASGGSKPSIALVDNTGSTSVTTAETISGSETWGAVALELVRASASTFLPQLMMMGMG